MAAPADVAYKPSQVAHLICRVKTYTLMGVVAVLTARSDGSQALGKEINGKVLPAEPYLRDPSVHKNPDSNYVTDEIKQLNAQLLASGARFGLDVENIEYVLERNDDLHGRECNDDKDKQTVDLIGKRAAQPGSPYKNRVIIIYRWGSDPDTPAWGACSGVYSPYLLMGYHRVAGFMLDGKPQYQNNILTHEFGHFMGLPHTHPEVTVDLEHLSSCSKTLVAGMVPVVGNPDRWPLRIENLVHMTGVTPADLAQQKQHAEDVIPLSHGGQSFDFDRDHDLFGPLIEDTPPDLGWGLPLDWGDWACIHKRVYQFTRYAAGDLDPQTDSSGKVVDWKPKPGAAPTIAETVTLDDGLRQNFMSYFVCDHVPQRFSPHQVRRMEWVLANHRKNLIARKVETRSAGCAAFSISARAVALISTSTRAGRAAEGAWDFVARRILPRRSKLARLVERNLLVPAHLWQPAARRKHLNALERSGTLARMQEMVRHEPWCGVRGP